MTDDNTDNLDAVVTLLEVAHADLADTLYSKCKSIFLITETGAARAARTWHCQGFRERCANQSNKCKSVFM